ncbi:uncharacterized protein [Hoplias malabaricus]|uniref:uncharacterized protein n=1 Tax=Hoplias malabaricus TaxID=27720 RepID=UPI0034637297
MAAFIPDLGIFFQALPKVTIIQLLPAVSFYASGWHRLYDRSRYKQQDRDYHSSRGSYGIRRKRVPPKHLRDYFLEGELPPESVCGTTTSRRRTQSKARRVATGTRRIEGSLQDLDGGEGSTLALADRAEEPRNPAHTSLTAERKRKREELQESESVEEKDTNTTPPLPTTAPTTASVSENNSLPLLTLGHTQEEFQRIFHSVVDPMVRWPSGRPRPCSLELSLGIKQRLWETLRCPTITEEVSPDGRVTFTETYSDPGFRSSAPRYELDTSGEPLPKKPRV